MHYASKVLTFFKGFLFLILLTSSSINSFAGDTANAIKGRSIFEFGAGFLGHPSSMLNPQPLNGVTLQNYSYSITPGFIASVDYGVSDVLSIGGSLSYMIVNETGSYSINVSPPGSFTANAQWSAFDVKFRLLNYVITDDKFSLYTGIEFVWVPVTSYSGTIDFGGQQNTSTITSSTTVDETKDAAVIASSNLVIGLSGIIGARYFFSEKYGVWVGINFLEGFYAVGNTKELVAEIGIPATSNLVNLGITMKL